jgi:hypothetical protein
VRSIAIKKEYLILSFFDIYSFWFKDNFKLFKVKLIIYLPLIRNSISPPSILPEFVVLSLIKLLSLENDI